MTVAEIIALRHIEAILWHRGFEMKGKKVYTLDWKIAGYISYLKITNVERGLFNWAFTEIRLVGS